MGWTALFTILCNYGCRIGEALALTWPMVDFAHMEITFPTLKRRAPMTRTLPLLPEVAGVLLVWQECRDGHGPCYLSPLSKALWNRDDPRVFPMSKSGRYVAWHTFQVLCARAGVPTTALKTLRHTVGTKLAMMDLATARDVLGHASIARTTIYIHAVKLREHFATLKAVT